jgi:hypothetical protein
MDEEAVNKWNSRKLAFALVALFIHVGLLYKGLISDSIYADIAQAIIWGYLAAQAGADIFRRSKNRSSD